ncbi:MAG: WavE lipopolysaccharide synthesis family protein [bacterium]|nr:WavE lipopolysaccharide synthesis family protein [bacterium]
MKKYIEKTINFFEVKKEIFFTFHARPAFSVSINKKNESQEKDTAIVIQGPIIKEMDFTLETIKTYIKIFPFAHIILSTWSDEDMENFKDLGIKLLLNKKPEYPGISNINYQIVSTLNGIIAAKKLRVIYILKTRTDQRIYNEKAITYFKDLLKIFPIENTKKPRGRIITTDMNTFKYRLYSISDMTLFGFFEDMLNYWNLGIDTRMDIKHKHKNIMEWSRAQLCEVFLSTNYLEKMGEKLTWSIADSWKKYIDYFCIADRSIIDLYWFKYEKNKEYRNKNYNGNFMNEEFEFVDWLKLYNSKDFNNTPEYLLNKQIVDKI